MRVWKLLLLCSAMTLFGVGCANPFGVSNEGQRLIPEAKAARMAVPDPPPLPRELEKQMAGPYIVEPGDVLLLQPADFDSPVRIPGDQPVLPDGTINLGKYGRVIVAGLTVDQIEGVVRDQIMKQAKEAKNAGPVLVRLVSRQSKVFYVLGEVNSPGAFPLAGRETVLDAILVAGGVNTRADLARIILSRPTHPEGCRVVLPICYEQIVQLGDTSTNYQIQAGDRIFVPARGSMDTLLHHFRKDDCSACSRPQIPCFTSGECAGNPCSTWRPAPQSPLISAIPRLLHTVASPRKP
jgi:polysaccharide export outer membrane protein